MSLVSVTPRGASANVTVSVISVPWSRSTRREAAPALPGLGHQSFRPLGPAGAAPSDYALISSGELTKGRIDIRTKDHRERDREPVWPLPHRQVWISGASPRRRRSAHPGRHSRRGGTLAPHMRTRKLVPAIERGAPADREGRRVNFRRRRRRHTSLLPLRSIEQVRRENAILVGAGLAWWVL